MVAAIAVIILWAYIFFLPIGDINARLGYIQSKCKKVKLGPILIKIVPQKDTAGAQYFEYRPKEKEVYLLTVFLTFLNIILAAGLCIASILFFIFTEVDLFVFLVIMLGYVFFFSNNDRYTGTDRFHKIRKEIKSVL